MRPDFSQLNKQLLNKFCNLLMRSGNISKARGICTKGFNHFLQLADQFNSREKLEKTQLKQKGVFYNFKVEKPNTNNPIEGILHRLIENVRPLVEVRRVRVARATHQVPAQISKPKGQTLALRWIIEFANKRKQKDLLSFDKALALELLDAHKKRGGPRQRRGEVHRLASANRSVMRYRWW